MLFTMRHTGAIVLSEPVEFSDLHIADRQFNTDRPEWSTIAYCHNGGANLKFWTCIELAPEEIHSSHICKRCQKRLEAQGKGVSCYDRWIGIDPGLTEEYGGQDDS